MGHLEAYFAKTAEKSRSKSAISFLASLDHLKESHPKIAAAIEKELSDQRSRLKLIASENYSSLAVQLAMGNLLTDKYAEGYVKHRFYAGCENVDTIEAQAETLLKELFGADAAYAQPHSGSDANLIAIWALITQKIQSPELEKLGKKNLEDLTESEYETIRQKLVNQKILGMSLNAGGHLTHGYRHNISSKMMQAFHYDVNPKTERIEYSEILRLAKEIKPFILLAGYSAYPRKIDFAKMREIADETGAYLMVDMAHFSGLVAGKAFSGPFDPVGFAHIVTSTTHKTLRGPRGGIVLCKEEFSEAVHRGCPLVMGGPLPHVMAAKTVAFAEAMQPSFREYTSKILENASTLAESLRKKGIRLTTGGTENHLMIADLTGFGLTGRHAELALGTAGLMVNRNAIPFDQNGPWYTSGIRIGTPAVTSLGMGKAEMEEIAAIIFDVLRCTTPKIVEKTGLPSKAGFEIDLPMKEQALKRVEALLSRFPLYPEVTLDNSLPISHNTE